MKSIYMAGHIIITIILILHAQTSQAQEPGSFSGNGDYNYNESSGRGPSQWGNLNPDWILCKTGKMQSPVDVTNVKVETVTDSVEVDTEYKASLTTLVNRGHDIALEWTGDAGYIEINGIYYQLQQVHWHVPSEHTVNGKRFELERHAVHVNAKTGNIAVLAVLYKIGGKDPFLKQMKKYLKTMVKSNITETYPGMIDPDDITEDDESFYRYSGSLTTPPCTEGVIWTVQKKIMTVSQSQVDLLLNAVHGNENARPLQAINKRKISLYVPCDDTDSARIFLPKKMDWSVIVYPLEYLQRKLFYSST
ncbi:hypothetical protein ACET3Z_009268 [Daucus carota]